jgi:hypothetical protein
MEKELRTNPAFAPVVRTILGVVVAVIVVVAVGIPVVTSVISDAGLTGTTATIVNLIPLMLGLLAFVITTSVI